MIKISLICINCYKIAYCYKFAYCIKLYIKFINKYRKIVIKFIIKKVKEQMNIRS